MNASDIVSHLIGSLVADPFQAKEVTPSQLLTEDNESAPIYLCRGARLRFERVGFELLPRLVVSDRQLGSLGFVQVFDRGQGEPGETLERWIDEATYARHLLLTDASAQKRAPSPVELVMVLPAYEGATEQIADRLRHLARRTPYLHAISVNLLIHEEGEAPDEIAIQKAFSWLLPTTRSRLRGNSGAPTGRLAAIRLANYRLAASRQLRLHPQLPLHVIHGHNGSGKSSLVEALELGLTGNIARIDATQRDQASRDYLSVIANRTGVPVTVTFELRGAETATGTKEHVVTLGKDGVAGAMASSLDARSFRLNQAFMDTLTVAGDADRAEALLRAFFPNARSAYERLEASRAALAKALNELPNAPTSPDASFEATLAQANQGAANKLDLAALLCPVDPALAQLVDPLGPGLSRIAIELTTLFAAPNFALGAANTQLDSIAAAFDAAIRALQQDLSRQQATLAKAVHLVHQLEHWVVSVERHADADLSGPLRQWLNLIALTDVGERLLLLGDTRALAQSLGSAPPPRDEQVLWDGLPATNNDVLRGQVQRWRSQRDEAGVEVKRLATEPTGVRGSASQGQHFPPPRLAPEELAVLDEVGTWLFGTPGFGAAIGRALTHHQHETFVEVTIGSPEWTKGWATRLVLLAEAAEKLGRLDIATLGATIRLARCRGAAQAAAEKLAAANEVEETFDSLIKDLERPLNELLAMFTPARWAYSATSLTPAANDSGGRSVRLLTTDGARADLRYNTAELNTLTIALFLLCATRVDNPLRILVLDDPFQNMDELTISTVLRGLSRVARLLPQAWQVVILIHGEETLETVRRELACATYQLPWLSPLRLDEEKPIDADRLHARETGLQPLPDILKCEALPAT